MSAKLDESRKQLLEITSSEDARVEELRKISQDRDRAWQSELEAVQKQHSMDSAALASAMSEIQKLKVQLNKVAESEAVQSKHAESAHVEIQNLRIELSEIISLVEKLRTELNDCKESETRAHEVVSKTQMQLEAANATIEMLHANNNKAAEAYNTISLEFEQSKMQAKSLEELVSKLQANLVGGASKQSVDPPDNFKVLLDSERKEMDQLKEELNFAKFEVEQLRSALDAAETRYQEEYMRRTLQIRSAYEQVERVKSDSCQREAELEAELKKTKAHIDELRANLMDKETELQSIMEENEGLNVKMGKDQPSEKESELVKEVKKLEADLIELRASLLAKDIELHSTSDHNEMLKVEIKKRELESNKVNDEAIALVEAAQAAEREALAKLDSLTEEADNSSRKVAHFTEQLVAAQATNAELEGELRRLKVQSDQWRKAAEAAAAMLSTTNNGKHVEKTGTFDNSYSPLTGYIGSPYSDDMDDESPKKKNGNMLKRIGGLWKKSQR